jgi:hypothetical protein
MNNLFYEILFGKPNPVRSCEVYKEINCSHVDGMLCDYPECQILKDYRELKVSFYYVSLLCNE